MALHYIRPEREERAMTRTELARKVEVSIASLSPIEREPENPPRDHRVTALVGALAIPSDDLFAVARRLPPDLRAHTHDVMGVYRRQTAPRGRDEI